MRITARLALLAVLFLCSPPVLASSADFRVVKVLDGDTIVVDNGERVRLIGIDTTEKSHPTKPVEYFSEEATQFTRRLLEGKQVRLEYDTERRDKYGRLLAYVYLKRLYRGQPLTFASFNISPPGETVWFKECIG